MDHRDYIDTYLSAHADGELSGNELRDASAHVADCALCRAELETERKLKVRLRRHLRTASAPTELRTRLAAELARRPKSPRMLRWIAVGVAAGAIAALILLQLDLHQHTNRLMDLAAAGYAQTAASFTPNVNASSPGALATELSRQAGFPVSLWNFSRSGMTLVGSRLERLSDGQPVIYTLYRGAKGTVLCILTPPGTWREPAHPLAQIGPHRMYGYRGLTVTVTQTASVLCVLVSNLKPSDMTAAIAAAS